MTDKIITDPKDLSRVCRETTAEEVQELNLVNRLRLAMKESWTPGVGLAAIQIGIPIRFAWYIDNQKKERTLLNPVILERHGKQTDSEACLSIPGKWIDVERAYAIVYTSNGKKKKTSGFEARLIQHEIDHMDGILISDRGKRD